VRHESAVSDRLIHRHYTTPDIRCWGGRRGATTMQTLEALQIKRKPRHPCLESKA